MVERMTKAMDQDGDRSISKEEFTKAADTMKSRMPANAPSTEDAFKAIDSNGDAAISKDELAALLDRMPAPSGRPGASSGAPHGGPHGPPPGGGGAPSASGGASKKASTEPADSNEDGKVSEQEETNYRAKQALAAYRANASTTEAKETVAA